MSTSVDTGAVPDLDRAARLGPLVAAGGAVVLAFFGGLGGWAATAPLAGAVVAPAIVAPEGHRKVVQHLEGGIVREILVREGGRVEADQPLVRLDDTRARSELAELKARWNALRAAQARLDAESRGLPAIAFDPDLEAAAGGDAALAAAMAAEQEQLAARRAEIEGRLAVLGRRAEKERRAIEGFEAEVASSASQAALIDEEIAGVSSLLARGFETKTRLLGLQRAWSELEGRLAAARAQIERSREAIAEAEAEMASVRQQRAAEVAAKRATAQGELAQVKETLKTARDRLDRTVIRSPVAGTIVSIRFKTLGGVAGPGEPILDLVPADERLVLEARVAPNDIDEVAPRQPAQVYLTAYQVRHLPRLTGVVEYVSADRLTDEATRQPYYAARVVVERAELDRLAGRVTLTPGMPAEAMIATRERTMLDYLLAPLDDLLRRGMRET